MMTVRGGIVFAALAAVAATAEAQPRAATPRSIFVATLIRSAIAQTAHPVTYDGSYRRIGYPGGDVPPDIGVCTDLVVRAYRAVGVDLQVRVHEDMTAAFASYPHAWGLARPDSNIDHRRVPNLQTYFRRRGAQQLVTDDAAAYVAGDLVTWTLPGNVPHIGLVTDQRSLDGKRPLMAHNIGRGPEIEDMLFSFPVTGHYRYAGE
jgi:uncharacterized protein YijF (DUF1287 family)